MPAGDRGGLKSAFAGFKKAVDEEAELKLLGRTVGGAEPAATPSAATAPAPAPQSAAVPSVLVEASAPVGQGTAAPSPGPAAAPPAPSSVSYQVATNPPARFPAATAAPVAPPPSSGLIPRPLRAQREAVRQLSFRCPVSLAGELRRKAAFNQLEHQEIIIEGVRRVLAELEEPPAGWNDGL